jgi:cell division protease FtsH
MSIKKKPKLPRPQQMGWILVGVAGVIVTLNYILPQFTRPKVPTVPYSEFLEQVKENKVSGVQIGSKEIRYRLKSENTGEQLGPLLSTTPVFDPELVQRLEANGVLFQAAPPPTNTWFAVLLNWVIPPIILVVAFQFFLNRGNSQSLAISKSKAKIYVEGESEKITFADVAGVEEAKVELAEIVEFLKSPDRFKKIGARIPKGVLLVGPPGTGKTLLAKAVAGEAKVSFFSISASEFVELFVGTGAARVRDLFEQAKKKAPCIIFIDELDAIGKSRSNGAMQSGSNDEREQTLNQLLTEMDGFGVGDATVIVLAATNRPEALDAALLRPGRFDRQVLVDRPDLAGRLTILEIYAKKVKLGDDIDLRAIATQTPGFAGADLANLVNEAALLAARNHREAVSQADFKEAIERVIAGLEKKSRVLSDREKKRVAYHEVGHAIVGALMPAGSKVAKISIVPRGLSALGYTLKLPTEDRFLMEEWELRDQIAMLLGGRAAEELIFGTISTGASDDLQRATNLAEQMVTTYGMSKVLGPLAYQKLSSGNFLGNGSGNTRRMMSDDTAQTIDREVKEIIEKGYAKALSILSHNQELMENMTEELLETEVLEGEQLYAWLDQVNSVSSEKTLEF